MQLTDRTFTLLDELPYLCARPGGGGTMLTSLPLWRGEVRGLPPELDGLLLTSDLQGVAPLPSDGGRTHLLGEVFAERYAALAEVDERVPDPSRVAALIAGDMYSGPRARKRGATGDVTGVWLEFARTFGWVAGVAGNHDLFPSGTALRLIRRQGNTHRLDGDVCELAGLHVGGVSGIIGNKRKPNRHAPAQYAGLLMQVLRERPDIVVLHNGPPGGARQRGDPRIAETLAPYSVPLVVIGHCHWDEPRATLGASTVLNVDGRAVLLVPADDTAQPDADEIDAEISGVAPAIDDERA